MCRVNQIHLNGFNYQKFSHVYIPIDLVVKCLLTGDDRPISLTY